jgi:hypothetical protein
MAGHSLGRDPATDGHRPAGHGQPRPATGAPNFPILQKPPNTTVISIVKTIDFYCEHLDFSSKNAYNWNIASWPDLATAGHGRPAEQKKKTLSGSYKITASRSFDFALTPQTPITESSSSSSSRCPRGCPPPSPVGRLLDPCAGRSTSPPTWTVSSGRRA